MISFIVVLCGVGNFGFTRDDRTTVTRRAS